jgi:hypothetical protein
MNEIVIFFGLHKREYNLTKVTAKFIHYQLKDENSIKFYDMGISQFNPSGYRTSPCNLRRQRIYKILKERPRLVIDIHARKEANDDPDIWGWNKETIGDFITSDSIIFDDFSQFLRENGFKEKKKTHFRTIFEKNQENVNMVLDDNYFPARTGNMIMNRCYGQNTPYVALEVEKPKEFSDYISSFIKNKRVI